VTTLLEVDKLSVEFPGVKALKAVSFRAEGGKVHALMGENGAGKSTLLKVLGGVNRPSSGGLRIDGQAVRLRGAAEALDAGIAIIYQELNMAPNMTVSENLLLGQLPSRLGFVDRRALRARAQQIISELGEDIDPDTRVGELSIGQRQMVEIGKALLRNARIIAFDEPTSSLSVREIDSLKRIVRRLRDEGRVIIYVTHRMQEVFELCDTVTVFRDGACIAAHPDIGKVTHDSLVAEMVGRAIDDIYAWRPRTQGEVLLEVRGLTGPGVVEPVDFTLRRGEILGFFGLVGAGRTELIRLICGAARPRSGDIVFEQKAVKAGEPRAAIRRGIALCPEDRKQQGIFPTASITDNLNISARRHTARGGLFVNRAWEADNAQRYIERLNVRPRDAQVRIGTLSGGNQQKVILARWLSEKIELLVMDEPTRGIDVGARAEIYSILYALAESGKAIIVISSDLPEVAAISDRVAVMREGRLVDIVDRSAATPERLLKLALPG
jgi:L-arabinose transport system ATP-binding protein